MKRLSSSSCICLLLGFLLAACQAAAGTPAAKPAITTMPSASLTETLPPPTLTQAPSHTSLPHFVASDTRTAIGPTATTVEMGSLDNLGSIAYISMNAPYTIGLINPDGSNWRALYQDAGSNLNNWGGLAWSPDGASLTYTTQTWADIYILNVETGTTRNITRTEGKFELYPSWSPRGNQIAFSITTNGEDGDIFFMDIDGSNITQLTFCEGMCFQPAWSPRGDQIAFVKGTHSTGFDIYTMHPDGSNQKVIALGGQNFNPDWSPDGRQIAFSRRVGYETASFIYLMNSDGSGLKALTAASAGSENPSWSPDGRFIVYQQSPLNGGGAALHLVELSTGNDKALTSNVLNFSPAWKPGPLVDPADIHSLPDCTDGWTRLKAGGQAVVLGAPSDPPNRVRSEPKKADNQIGQVFPGSLLTVLEGPVCADGLVFWKVSSGVFPGGAGWTAEGDGKDFWLEPNIP